MDQKGKWPNLTEHEFVMGYHFMLQSNFNFCKSNTNPLYHIGVFFFLFSTLLIYFDTIILKKKTNFKLKITLN